MSVCNDSFEGFNCIQTPDGNGFEFYFIFNRFAGASVCSVKFFLVRIVEIS